MEVDFELSLNRFPRTASKDLAGAFTVEVQSNTELGDVILRSEKVLQPSEKLDATLAAWLVSLKSHSETIQKCNATVRLGIYYDFAESVVFALQMSAETIQALSQFNLAIDITGYPCAEEQ